MNEIDKAVLNLCKRVFDIEDTNRLLSATLGVTIGALVVLAGVTGIWCWKTTQTIDALADVVEQIVEYINGGAG